MGDVVHSRKVLMRFSLLSLLAAIFVVAGLTPGVAKPRGSSADPFVCFTIDKEEQDCNGAICYCCYDDGCWICGNKGEYGYMLPDLNDCTWDPAYRNKINIPGHRPTDVSPGQNQNQTPLPLSPLGPLKRGPG
jgi:hypothetical protein